MSGGGSPSSRVRGWGPARLIASGLAGAILMGTLLAGCRSDQSGVERLSVFAAASLTDAVEALADSFQVLHPNLRVEVNVAATSLLARQIGEGAVADVFISANEDWMRFLEDRDLVGSDVVRPIGNRLVVVGRTARPDVTSLRDLVGLTRVAVADPDHVPAGMYARSALECVGVWEQMRERIVPTLDVRAALLAVEQGAVDAAIVYFSDLYAASEGHLLFEIDAACQPDIRYAFAVPSSATSPELGRTWIAFAVDPSRSALWERYGFTSAY